MKIILFLALLFTANPMFAQEKTMDKLVMRNGTIISCMVKEIGDEEIKYAEEGLRD
ncbi:MAG: hypothetical protein U5K51_09135 [Flavobacteriaceae bacterium]|nr:hypothetical protein [Flavobacteriaceae bacterium]